MNWREASPDKVRAEVATHPVMLALFGIADCTACERVKRALGSFDFLKFRVVPILVEFSEFNPDHASAIEELRLSVFPHVRLYAGGRLIGAWESVAEGATDADIRAFTEGWLARTLFKFLSRTPGMERI